ncbi:inovirus Gp2 family protein [Vibrio fluvialis]|nr:inovirus Gp2 family protein [Vibrio fluvialis]
MNTYQSNGNLTIHNESTYQGLTVLKGYSLVKEYLDAIHGVMGNAMSEYSRVVVMRFDLHLPLLVSCPDFPLAHDTNVITRFMESVKAQLKARTEAKSRKGIRVRPCTVRYIWVKERNESSQPHYHIALVLNRDAYGGFGSFCEVGNNLAGVIYKAWARVLSYEPDDIVNLVHFPKNPLHFLTRHSPEYSQQCNQAFQRLSYFAKAETKWYGTRAKNFGCSRR